MGPLLTLAVHEALRRAAHSGLTQLDCSLDLERSQTRVDIGAHAWHWQGTHYPYLARCKPRTVYAWIDGEFQAVAHYSTALYKLVPTEHGPPTFEIDGVKMLPSAHVSPYADAMRKVALVEPRDSRMLDTCGGLGYFAACCLTAGAREVVSCEKSPAVLWLRQYNPWSPAADARLRLMTADILQAITAFEVAAFDAVLHDPPRFGTAGELYSLAFYTELARVLKRNGRLFHYTGSPNALTSGRDVPAEVARRLQQAGFSTSFNGDGVLAVRR